MRISNRISKKKLLETYKNNYQLMFEKKQELYHKNIELQKKMIEQEKIINEMKKERKSLKSKLTKAKKELETYKKIEIAPSIETGNKIIEEHFKKEKGNE